MPEMDGYTAAHLLRTKNVAIPVIALTAHAMSDERERCLAAGCCVYATKPIDRRQLLKLVHTWGDGDGKTPIANGVSTVGI